MLKQRSVSSGRGCGGSSVQADDGLKSGVFLCVRQHPPRSKALPPRQTVET